MCINFNGYHSGGSSFLNVNDCWLLQKNYLYTTDIRSALKKNKKNKKNKKSQYMVSHPETGSDSPIGSDRGRGRVIISIYYNFHVNTSSKYVLT